MTKFDDRLNEGVRQWGDKFDPASLNDVDKSVRDAYNSGQRVKVRATYAGGETFERTGVVTTTTGWKPAFLLKHRANAHGSWDVLNRSDKVVAVWDGRKYVEVR